MTTPRTRPDTAAEHAANEAFAELLFSPEGLADPYSRYRRLREAAPVHRSTLGTWVLTGYDDVDEFLRSKQVEKDIHIWMANRFSGEWEHHQALRKLAANLLWTNPPEHTRMRRLVNRAFSEKRVLEHRAFIERRFEELIAPVAEAGEGDVCNQVFFPLALSVVADLIGVPQDEAPLLRDKIRDFQRTFEPGMTASELLKADQAAKFLDDYFAELVRSKQRRRGDDLVSALLDIEDDGGSRLDFDDLVQMCHMVIAAGSETTTFFLTNGVRLFAEHPDQARLVSEDRSLLRSATEEILRYMPSAHMIPRTTAGPVTVGGVEIPAGARVMVWIAAANRDPLRFPDPDRFDVTRKDAAPMSYGLGTHYCLGWRLANLQAEVVFSALFDRFTDIELTEPLRHRARVAFPQIEALRIRFRRRSEQRPTAPGTVRFLSPEYLAAMESLAPSEQPAIPHVNVKVQFRATEAPEGEVDYHLLIEKGAVVGAGRGPLVDADLEITARYRDLLDFQSTRLDATEAFVSGRFAVSGDRAKLLELMMVLQSGTYHQYVAELWERTTW
ncbi:cytochrome P450 [Kitasatospora sp. SolWspMP-SS2h]|uniref:cytochrome P450 n=1 Tax=Kitasatospora sp. SolWspMP-SS2h TaxID=1305729 RepID=UPI000DB9258F|nr:cytochrome P450 [Kitasatospora sp. SolWspMP-SS2h]RAJ32088.1 cytochrome P450 [Kitasatospora sp. SolWspMP-SS2h]